MTDPTPDPAPFPMPEQIAYFLQVSGRTDIFAVFHNGAVRHALPVEWNGREVAERPVPVVAGSADDFRHALALANALRQDPGEQ